MISARPGLNQERVLIRARATVWIFGVLGLLACSSSSGSGELHTYGPAELYGGSAAALAGGGGDAASGGSPASDGGASTSGSGGSSEAVAGTNSGGASAGASSANAGSAGSSAAGSGGASNAGAGGSSAGAGGSAHAGSSSGGGAGGSEQILSRGKPATADSEQTTDGNTAAMGNDGVLSTRWCAADAATGHYWQVDLGASHSLTRFTISWEKVEIYQFKVEGSADQTTWTTLSDQTASTDDSSDQSFTLTGSPSARYVKITVTGLNGGAWASFFELSVYGY